METLSSLALGFSVALQPQNLLSCFIGVFVGSLVGVLPGIGASATIAILLPITSGLSATSAIIMLAGVYYGSQYGGSTTSILVNIPGEASSVVTALDGYPLAKQGRAGPALGMAAIASFIAGTGSLFGLVLVAPTLAGWALRFGPPEYFAIIVMGLSMIVSLAGRSMIKGLISGLLGLLIATIGIDTQVGVSRFAFGNANLMSGIDLVAVVVGLFAIGEVLSNAERPAVEVYETRVRGLLPTLQDWKDSSGALWRSTILGFLMGLVPGITATVVSFVAYDIERKSSKHPELFGTGRIEGVAAPEAANNSCTSGAMVPLLTLGLPTIPSVAMLMGAFMIHGLQPGPLLFELHPDFVWGLIASMYVGNAMLLVLNLPLIAIWVRLVQIPYPLLAPGIFAVCLLGAYSLRNNMFDVWVTVGFGFLGYLMRKLDVPTIPLVIAVVLGDRAEMALRQSLAMAGGSFSIFFVRPFAALVLAIAVGSIVLAIFRRAREAGDSAVLASVEKDVA